MYRLTFEWRFSTLSQSEIRVHWWTHNSKYLTNLGRREFNSTLHQSSHGYATSVHGFATKTKALAREIRPATQAMQNTGRGKHGVSITGKHGVKLKKKKTLGNHYFAKQWIFLINMRSQNFVILNCNENHLTRYVFLDHESGLNISWERKPFKCQRAVQWFSFAWASILFFAVTCVNPF